MVYNEAKILLTDKEVYNKMAESVNPYGDDKASECVIQVILYHYGMTDNRSKVFIW